MAKFNFKQWIKENKGPYSKFLKEQTASTSSAAWTGAAGGTATDFTQGDFNFNTNCTNFNQIPSDFQDLICTQCEDPSYVNMHCECCSGIPNVPSDGTGIATGATSPGFGSDAYVPPNIGGGNVPNQTMVPGGISGAKPASAKKYDMKRKKRKPMLKLKETIKEALKNLKENKLGGPITCWCGENNTPQSCPGIMIGNKLNCTCCGR